MNNNQYPRDMIGYGAHPPKANWPNRARIAVQFVINYEEGGENNILHGDSHSEKFLSEIIGAEAFEGVRHLNMESFYEYGSRAGFWRLYRMFTERGMPTTVFGVAMALQRNPEAVAAMKEADWEIATHGYRWIDYQFIDAKTERNHLDEAVRIHTEVCGSAPQGVYIGRASPNTHQIIAEHGGFTYCADTYADDVPYWELKYENPLLMVPYTLDANDMRFATAQGFNSGDQFFSYLKDAFDVLYQEGSEYPRMMSIGLHCRLAGRPGRAAAVARFLDYIQGHENVWIAKRIEIAELWRNDYPPQI